MTEEEYRKFIDKHNSKRVYRIHRLEQHSAAIERSDPEGFDSIEASIHNYDQKLAIFRNADEIATKITVLMREKRELEKDSK